MTYTLLKFLHIVATAVWLGGLIMLTTINARLATVQQNGAIGALSAQGAFFSTRVFMPSAAFTLITGIALVLMGGLSFGAPFVSWGFAGVILSFAVGGGLVRSTAIRLARAAAEGQTGPAVDGLRRRLVTFNALNLLILLSTVFAMVWKP